MSRVHKVLAVAIKTAMLLTLSIGPVLADKIASPTIVTNANGSRNDDATSSVGHCSFNGGSVTDYSCNTSTGVKAKAAPPPPPK